MIRACEALSKTSLFAGLERSTFQEYCYLTRLRTFAKGEILAAEGDLCSSIGIIEKGRIAMQKYTSGGDFATIALLKPGDFFGEDLIFGSSNVYTFTLEAMSLSEVLFVNKETLNALIERSPVVKGNFLRILSDRVLEQNKRIALLSQKSIRQKIAYYLLDLRSEKSGSSADGDTVRLPVSKEVIAKLLAMPRPSFSRELILMKKDGVIDFNGRNITLLDIAKLETEVVEGLQYGG
ncbi:MAG: Crp/Fnr family transcriptional regulator [Oscillospiraceae bacterium]|jgi:CRP-like cAMP-binding protein|nr:Crp/Fnr family transcriptional regulator [Oscillospiraceae bacterium]